MTIKTYRGVTYVDNKVIKPQERSLKYRGVDYVSSSIEKREKAKSGIYRGFAWSA